MLAISSNSVVLAVTSSFSVNGKTVNIEKVVYSSSMNGKTEYDSTFISNYVYTTVSLTGNCTNGSGSYSTVTGSSSGVYNCSKTIYPKTNYYFTSGTSYHTAGYTTSTGTSYSNSKSL